MPDNTDSNRKRSRSPSDSSEHQKHHKRPNTGLPPSASHDSTTSSTQGSATPAAGGVVARDVNMADAHQHHRPSNDDGTASTPSPSRPSTDSSMAYTKGERSVGDLPSSLGEGNGASTSGGPSSSSSGQAPPSAHIHMRCLIVTQDASIIIGRAGAHVNEIRDKSGARVMVSESIPGNPERILNVSGPLDAVSKAFGLIVRRINDEPFDKPSVPGSRAVTIKFMIPNSRMGSVIGKGGSKIKEIQEASGARLNASEGMLPGSTERVLSVSGVADAIHIATYYIGNILIEANERMPTSSNSSYRPSTVSRRPPYPVGGTSGSSVGGGGSSYVPGYSNPYAQTAPAAPVPPQGPLQTQQIYIPNDLVGCIIGKGGSKINEIRHMSASQIKIMEPGATGAPVSGAPAATEGERLVVITGQPANIQMAVQLLYHRLEQEKQKQLRAQQPSGSNA